MEERHVVELLTLLERDGWTHKLWRGGRKTKTPMPYEIGHDQIWYLSVRAIKFNSLYFECLLKALIRSEALVPLAFGNSRAQLFLFIEIIVHPFGIPCA